MNTRGSHFIAFEWASDNPATHECEMKKSRSPPFHSTVFHFHSIYSFTRISRGSLRPMQTFQQKSKLRHIPLSRRETLISSCFFFQRNTSIASFFLLSVSPFGRKFLFLASKENVDTEWPFPMEETANWAFPLRKYFLLPDTFSKGYSCHSLPRKMPRCKNVHACFWKKLRCSIKNLERRLFLLYEVHWIVGLPPVYLLIKNSILQRLLRQELQRLLEIYKQKLHTRSYSYTNKSPLRILHPTSLKTDFRFQTSMQPLKIR